MLYACDYCFASSCLAIHAEDMHPSYLNNDMFAFSCEALDEHDEHPDRERRWRH